MEAQRTGKPIVESPSLNKEEPPSTAGTASGGKRSKSPSKKPDKKSMSQANEVVEDPFLPCVVAGTPECVKLDELNEINNNNLNQQIPYYRTLVHPLLANDSCADTKAVASELECISLYPDKICESNSYLWEAIYPKGIIIFINL